MLNVMWKICHAYSGREYVQEYTEICVKGTTDAILVCHLNPATMTQSPVLSYLSRLFAAISFYPLGTHDCS
jgi:hypothetical protein